MTDKNNEKNREEHGYGYDKSVQDLKVVGENKPKKNKEEIDERRK